jgi:hypothetical protein
MYNRNYAQNYDSAGQLRRKIINMAKFYYVYMLKSEKDANRFYSGFTEDLQGRLKDHNQGSCKHTSKHIP